MTSFTGSPAKGTRRLGILCVLVVGGIFTAGLWPFHSPTNQVSWVAAGNGLRFGHHGTILSSNPFKLMPTTGDAPGSIEVWVEPARGSISGTILAFYSRQAPRLFSLYQFYTGLDLQSEPQENSSGAQTSWLYVHNIFHPGKATFVTITSGREQTKVYVDGILAKQTGSFPFSGEDLAGQLVIANAPRTRDSWSGILRGLALYRQDLSPAEVLHHYETWIRNGRPNLVDDDRAVAIYLLDEHEGSIVHNQVPDGMVLYSPKRFLILDEYFLEPFWKEYKPSWGYYKDILVNIAGFVPLGFFFFAYLSIAGWNKKPELTTIVLGFAVSMTIEVSQAWLPTRDSGMTDIITNTSGTALGVWIYRWLSGHDLFIEYWNRILCGTRA